MQKVIFGIFAHPDDEAFGPCGTLVREVENGAELHLITLTAGEHGTNTDNVDDLGAVRLQEWHTSSQLLGASSTRYLGYSDGTLGNNDHVAITHQIETIVRDTLKDRHDCIVEFIGLELQGLTGHIDHIVASRSACLAFYRLKSSGFPMGRIRLACLAYADFPHIDINFVFMQAGHSPKEINETIDARPYLDKVRSIMYCHQSQRHDCETQIAHLGDKVAIDHFIVLS